MVKLSQKLKAGGGNSLPPSLSVRMWELSLDQSLKASVKMGECHMGALAPGFRAETCPSQARLFFVACLGSWKQARLPSCINGPANLCHPTRNGSR